MNTPKDSASTKSVKPVKENLVEGVLQNYLDQLLVTATETQPVVKVDAPVLHEEKVMVAKPVVDKVDTATQVKIATKKSTADLLQPNLQVAVETEEALAQKVQYLTDQESWSSQGVECLIFSVCGLSLAVPLLFLGGVHEVVKEDIRPLIGQPKWYLGMLHTDEGNLQVIDTAKFIMPERKCNLSNDGFKYLIRLEKTPWAIACQSIDATVRLEASEIKWRGERGKRTWLAGTVIEKMCALIDVSGLLEQVELHSKPN